MTFGLKLSGLNNSLPISSFAKALIFRGKAARVTGPGMTFYPADAVGTDSFVNGQYQSSGYTVSYAPGVAGRIRHFSRNGFNGGLSTAFDGAAIRNIVVLTYEVVCPDLPTVFINSTNQDVTGSIQTISLFASAGAASVWRMRVNVGFPVGLSEVAIQAALTLYCFSPIVAADLQDGYGLRTFTASGELAYSSELRPLRAKDYVTITGSSTPADLANLIYAREFCPTPEKSVFSMAKPAFMNVDFARYGWSETPYIPYWPYVYTFTNNIYIFWRYCVVYDFATTGVTVKNGELSFNLSAIDAKIEPFDITVLPPNKFWKNQADTSSLKSFEVWPPTSSRQAQYITYKHEMFPCTIPIIDGADYD